ncbi:MAG: adenylate/guanylate cyclase domain-containing protein [Gemmataceae bacterium]
MSTRLQVMVYEARQLKETAEFDGPVELGRQRDREETLYSRRRDGDLWRWVIARRDETTVGRNQMLLTPLPDEKVRVGNGSDRQPIRFMDAPELAPGGACDLPLPVLIVLGPTKTIRVQKATALNSLPGATLPPARGSGLGKGSRLPTLVGPGDGLRRDDVLQWLNLASGLLNLPAGTPDYFHNAAEMAVQTADLDAARLLLLVGGEWQPRGTASNDRTDVSLLRRPSGRVLDRVLTERKTFWEEPGSDAPQSESLTGVETVVAAPLLDPAGKVIGALYGERQRAMRPGQAGVGSLEAQLVELIARIVAGGLARVEEERQKVDAEMTMELFFGSALARQLRGDPDLLKGRDREVSVLFCDIRGFSRLSERLGAAQTIEWCRDVLDRMSGCVMAEGGVVVDYVGDGLMAMWGAPGEQPDHADRACRAALAMIGELPVLDRQWKGVLGEPMGLSVGVNTGQAQVGNVGSALKVKYGAMGNVVNLASRVQGAAKYFKCDVLITGQTRDRLSDEGFLTRRLGQVRVVNINAPVTLHQLLEPGWEPGLKAKEAYEHALERFEKGDFTMAARVLGNWRGLCPTDDPVLVLLFRAVRAMVEGVAPNHPVWELKEK